MPALIISPFESIVTQEKQTVTMVFTDRDDHRLEEYDDKESDNNEEDDDDLGPTIIAGVDEQSNNADNPPGLLL
jgi:hypothetical protein